MGIVERLWYGTTSAARVGRALLRPASWVYAAGVALRNARYARNGSAVTRPSVPVLSVGNLTVGGTGKTPVAAWAAARLRSMGASPMIVMRGYGDDEPLVHARLNPEIAVIASPDRVRGVEVARTRGADVAVLDDGFQHRRIGRTADWVLIAAEQWRADADLLPAGPLREPIASLSRADVIVVTRKRATARDADQVVDELTRRFPHVGIAACQLAMDALIDALTGTRQPLSRLSHQHYVAAAAVGDPTAFFSQLVAHGAVVERRAFSDHHAFTPADVVELASAAEHLDGVICTLKDAVKLVPLWPRAGPTLWYVSQIVVIERGHSVLDRSLQVVLADRPGTAPTAGQPARVIE